MSYIGNEPVISATRTVTEISATAGQTTFTANGGYTVGYIDVFVNGSQLQTSDFTATNGTSVTLNAAAIAGDDVRLVAWGTFGIVGNQTIEFADGSASAPSITNAGDNNTGMFFPAADTIAFTEGGVESMRIDSSGNLLVGRTSQRAGEFSSFTGTPISAGWNLECVNQRSSAITQGFLIYYPNIAPNNTASLFMQAVDNAATRFELRSNGGIANYSGNNVNLSDKREKTNIELASPYLDKICSIPVKTFNYIDQNLEEDNGLTLGVIAQDVQAVAPELVMESNWGTKDEPKVRLSIYQTDLQYALMKALQELNEKVEAQAAEIETLKANQQGSV
jgi:hypothetical protein